MSKGHLGHRRTGHMADNIEREDAKAQPGRGDPLQQRLGILQQPLIGVQAIHQLKDRVVQPVENKHPHQAAAAVIQGLKDLRRSQAAYQAGHQGHQQHHDYREAEAGFNHHANDRHHDDGRREGQRA